MTGDKAEPIAALEVCNKEHKWNFNKFLLSFVSFIILFSDCFQNESKIYFIVINLGAAHKKY